MWIILGTKTKARVVKGGRTAEGRCVAEPKRHKRQLDAAIDAELAALKQWIGK